MPENIKIIVTDDKLFLDKGSRIQNKEINTWKELNDIYEESYGKDSQTKDGNEKLIDKKNNCDILKGREWICGKCNFYNKVEIKICENCGNKGGSNGWIVN